MKQKGVLPQKKRRSGTRTCPKGERLQDYMAPLGENTRDAGERNTFVDNASEPSTPNAARTKSLPLS